MFIHASFHRAALPVKHIAGQYAALVAATAKSFGQFLYGDSARTHRTLCFAYGCIAVYMLALINARSFLACG